MIKIDLSEPGKEEAFPVEEGEPTPKASDYCCECCAPCLRPFRKLWKLARWLGQYDLYPLLSLNFFFRFAFAAYKSIFAFFCMASFGYGSAEVCRLFFSFFSPCGGFFFRMLCPPRLPVCLPAKHGPS